MERDKEIMQQLKLQSDDFLCETETKEGLRCPTVNHTAGKGNAASSSCELETVEYHQTQVLPQPDTEQNACFE